ncbi:hypothetical protein DQ04_14981010 [Trypanosoma grayi]|uniref:hypothetical protein n=1 Tax=Trypanosoma grayi TaxID=71804 RepID=UPI0004F4A0CA|nr:hypothetical protein DQ04_14981010 [Trypanosoma grayi]KEG06257.1 hypothetical protein DQ04_14981010 [Trypanosoma grayi]
MHSILRGRSNDEFLLQLAFSASHHPSCVPRDSASIDNAIYKSTTIIIIIIIMLPTGIPVITGAPAFIVQASGACILHRVILPILCSLIADVKILKTPHALRQLLQTALGGLVKVILRQ